MKTFSGSVAALAVLLLAGVAEAQVAPPKSSGVYLTGDEYRNGRLAFEGDCGSKTHKLELHDVLNKTYIDVTHETEKRRYQKSDLFGFRGCDGRDYRFASNLEYLILDTNDLYIYALEFPVTHGKGMHTTREYFFSAGSDGPVLALTLENLKQAFPDNHRFHDGLDATFGTRENLAQYDEFHKMFRVNRVLIASRESGH
jgi:hypothetical protein